jgi:hypothetical protein
MEQIIAAANARLATRKPSPLKTNIVGTLYNRELTRRSINMNIHQHYRRRIHLTWNPTPNTPPTCIERKFYYGQLIERVLHDLRRSPIQGICVCLWDDQNLPTYRRVSRKDYPWFGPYPLPQPDLTTDWWINKCHKDRRDVEERNEPCTCNVRASCFTMDSSIKWEWWENEKHNNSVIGKTDSDI